MSLSETGVQYAPFLGKLWQTHLGLGWRKTPQRSAVISCRISHASTPSGQNLSKMAMDQAARPLFDG